MEFNIFAAANWSRIEESVMPSIMDGAKRDRKDFPLPPYSLAGRYPLTGKSLSQLSDEPLVMVV